MIYTMIAVIKDTVPSAIAQDFDRELIAKSIRQVVQGINHVSLSQAYPTCFIRAHDHDEPVPYSLTNGPDIQRHQVVYFYLDMDVEMPPLFLVSILNDVPELSRFLFCHASKTSDAITALQACINWVEEDEMSSSFKHISEIIQSGIEAREEVDALVAKHKAASTTHVH